MSDSFRHVEHVMGTVFSFDVRMAPKPHLLDTLSDAVVWLHRMDALFSTYRPDSQISRLGRGDLTLAECEPELLEILSLGRDLEERTSGWFSLTSAGPLDPSALVKGWAVEHVSTRLYQAGARNHCVNGGGDVQARGEPEPGRPWQVGVTDPADRTRLLTTVVGNDLAVATSGTAERGHHIHDPHTGQPATDLLSLTLIGENLTLVDPLSTALFAMGRPARAWLDTHTTGLELLLTPTAGSPPQRCEMAAQGGEGSSTSGERGDRKCRPGTRRARRG